MTHEVILAGGRWSRGPRHFRGPLQVLRADDIGQVAQVVGQAEHFAKEGSFVAGYLSYEAAPAFDPRLKVKGVSNRTPLAWFGVYAGYDEVALVTSDESLLGPWAAGLDEHSHAAKVAAVKSAIRAGDTYQLNLTFPTSIAFDGDSRQLFAAMVSAQKESYAAFIDIGEIQILSVSPELFLRVDGRRATTHPMKGTAPRGRFQAEDLAREADLASSEKEQAGNVMIVDLLRSDLSRIAQVGSVEVPEMFSTERHNTVWQMTSTVSADIRQDVSFKQILDATFPSGSVTGAPKVSTMKLIAELETGPRGPYCGAIGVVEPGGQASEFSVAIRTGTIVDGVFQYHVGGGITWESSAADEYQECLWKALVVTRSNRIPGLVETMRYDPDLGIELLQLHVQRLMESAAYWGIDLDFVQIGEALSGLSGGRPMRVRLEVDPNGGLSVQSEPLDEQTEPVRLKLSEHRVDSNDPRWFHKLADRSHYPDTEEGTEAVLMNLDGLVTETNISNLMVKIAGSWFTPPIEDGCLPGVLRRSVVGSGRVHERSITVDDLAAATDIAVTNAVRGWRKALLTR